MQVERKNGELPIVHLGEEFKISLDSNEVYVEGLGRVKVEFSPVDLLGSIDRYIAPMEFTVPLTVGETTQIEPNHDPLGLYITTTFNEPLDIGEVEKLEYSVQITGKKYVCEITDYTQNREQEVTNSSCVGVYDGAKEVVIPNNPKILEQISFVISNESSTED